jgi:hypothetical protein
MNEFSHAVTLANRVLDRVNADPDDDLAVLARQFLRAREANANIVERLKDRIDTRLNNCLCEMKEGYDDSIVGFNEAWDIVRAVFKAIPQPPPAESTEFWECFHCGRGFTDRAMAKEHFGTRQCDAPLCIADKFELVATRKERDAARDELVRLRAQL